MAAFFLILLLLSFICTIISYKFTNIPLSKRCTINVLKSMESEDATKEMQSRAPCPMAPKCTGSYLVKGCDGTGKIQGGIATYPLFSWWPIKVYRPCPAYLQAGYQYRREGQTLDQVLFSEPSTKMKEKIDAMRAAELEEARKKAAEVDTMKTNDTNALDDSVIDRMYKERYSSKNEK
jgi:hypothetical protein